MKRASQMVVRILAIVCAVLLLLLPGILMALVHTAINFQLALASVALTMLLAWKFPQIRWFVAILTSLLIAIPPIPYWIVTDQQGWRFQLFYGIDNLPIHSFLILFVLATLLFALIFWAIRKR